MVSHDRFFMRQVDSDMRKHCQEAVSRNFDPQFEGLEEGHYVYRIRDKLRKQVLVPLHKALELPEVFMSANEWNSLPYNRVPSVAMKNYKKLFVKHDNDRFKEYLERVTSEKVKIAAGALLSHEIIAALSDGDGGEVAELQWKRMVDDLMKKGSCRIASRADPELHIVEGDTLLAKIEFVKRMDWGMNTNFQKVFDRILKVAIEGKLREEQLIKSVFVFSDMEFDVVCESPWEIDYEAIKRKFGEKGYENMPEIVFWNLGSPRSTSVVARQSGVALVSGFSKNLLTMFLEGDKDKLFKRVILILAVVIPHSRTLVPYPLISNSDIFGDNLGLVEITSAL
ncbi:Uncharacterized protein L728 [Camellia lanceoleosa]|uniref:Uncharacterized protein L728 n=1 Tax=Camellia lanceoleosa TaxID=1840588 RepID=A0ACC0GSI8_9ERIC|nr:Uncharacterized protein L728 [Camellia lanceoleosa]